MIWCRFHKVNIVRWPFFIKDVKTWLNLPDCRKIFFYGSRIIFTSAKDKDRLVEGWHNLSNNLISFEPCHLVIIQGVRIFTEYGAIHQPQDWTVSKFVDESRGSESERGVLGCGRESPSPQREILRFR